LFGCSAEDHGRLDAVFAKYHILQATAAAGTSGLTVPQESCLWGSYKLLLLVAAMQINDCGPTDQEKETIVRMQAQGVLPPSPWDPATFRAPPSPPGAPGTPADAVDAIASGSAKHRKRTGKWWEHPADAEWRHGDWTEPKPDRSRIIKVKGNKNEGWIELKPATTAELLAWYDKAQPLDEKKGVVTDHEKRHSYDYRFEGGKYLTQRNPNFPDSNPRECQVLYFGVAPDEGNW